MEMRSVGSCRHRAPSMEKTAADQVGLASLGACRWGCGLSCAGIPDDTGELDARVGRIAARCCISEGIFPPDFVSRWDEIVEGIAESLWMTVVSTVVGIALSIPVGIGAAKNIAPAPVYYFCRAVLAVSRSFQEIILAIFFVKLFGFGPFAGFVTLSFATIGFTASCSRKTSRTWMRARRKPCAHRVQAGCSGSTTGSSRR